VTTDDIPTTYEDWVHCITVKAGIELTPEFARERIAAIGDRRSAESMRFIRLYGESHWTRIVQWYRRVAEA